MYKCNDHSRTAETCSLQQSSAYSYHGTVIILAGILCAAKEGKASVVPACVSSRWRVPWFLGDHEILTR
jgi:hypothetical protein